MTTPALATPPDNVVPLTNVNAPSRSERAFRSLFETLKESKDSNEVRLHHLKGSLRGWMIAAKNPGFSPQTTRTVLDKEDEGLLRQLDTLIVDALRHQWTAEYLCTTLKVRALAQGTIEL